MHGMPPGGSKPAYIPSYQTDTAWGRGKALTWLSFCSNSFHANIYQPPTEACGALCLYYRPNVAQSFHLLFGVLKKRQRRGRQARTNCVSVAAALRAEQGPIKDCVSEIGE